MTNLPIKPLAFTGTFTGTEILPLTQNGAARRATLADIRAFLGGLGSLTVTTPASQAVGVAFVVTGTYANVTPAALDYSLDGGTTWIAASSPSIAAGAFSFSLTIAAANSAQTVRVRDHGSPLVVALSGAFVVAAVLIESAEGTAVTTVGPTIVDAALNVYSISPAGYVVTNGNPETTISANVVELAYHAPAPGSARQLFQKNTNSDWFTRTGITTDYYQTTDPFAPATPATVVSNLPAPIGSSSNTIAAAQGNNIVLDLTKRQGWNVPACLYGVSCGHLTVDGAPYDYHSLNDTRVQAAFNQMSFGFVRLNWDLNTTMDYIFGSGTTPNWTSVSNFIAHKDLFNLANNPLLITIGWPSSMNSAVSNGPGGVTGTYQNQCQQVAQHFKDNGITGIYWALGNEIRNYDINNCVQMFNAMSAGVRAADPTARCGGITDDYREETRLRTFVQNASRKPDFLDWHGYLGSLGDGDDTIIQRALSSGSSLGSFRQAVTSAGLAAGAPMGNTEFNVNGDPPSNDARNGNAFGALHAAIILYSQIVNDHGSVFGAPWDALADGTYGLIDGSTFAVRPVGKLITRLAQAMPGEVCASSVGNGLSSILALPTVLTTHFGAKLINYGNGDAPISLTVNGLTGSSYTRTEHSPANPLGVASTVSATSNAPVSMTLPAKSVVVLSN